MKNLGEKVSLIGTILNITFVTFITFFEILFPLLISRRTALIGGIFVIFILGFTWYKGGVQRDRLWIYLGIVISLFPIIFYGHFTSALSLIGYLILFKEESSHSRTKDILTQ